jgi:hypothetical protein
MVDIVPFPDRKKIEAEQEHLHRKFWIVLNKLAVKTIFPHDISLEDFRELEAEISTLEAEIESLLARLEGRRHN